MEQLGITVFDVAVIAVAVFGAAIGMSSGFAHAILFIGSWIGAGWLAWRFSKVIQPEVEQIVGSTELAYFISMLAVFVAALIVLVMLTNALSRSIKSSPLGKPDRILGAGFGVLCAWVAVGVAFLFYGYLGPRTLPPAVEGAATFPMVREMATFVEPHLPPGFRTRLQRPGMDTAGGTAAPPSPAAAPTTPTEDTKPPQ
ncbi:MAG: CvpA family protein [Reyranella sp.]|uniref:CvpA family protein n=1 Tax=Reyranella sp. TaxID=1929291 RepID=UPI0012052BEE|nr:CvpA family protein [Reyranella sp.]TAJ39437.1 MAG: CvpA family protein [Reyranella sp.]